MHVNKGSSLSTRLRRAVLGMVIVVIIVFLISVYLIVDRERREYEVRESENVLMALSSSIYSDINNYMELSRLIMMDERLVTFLRSDSEKVDIGMINDARYGVMDILNVTEGVDTVIVFREDMIMMAINRFYYTYNSELLSNDDWKKDIYDQKGRAVISLNTNNVASRKDNRSVITIGRAIYDLLSQQRTGLLMMNISTSVLEHMLGQLRYDNICIMGNDGTFLAGNHEYMNYYDSKFDSKTVCHESLESGNDKILVSGCRVADTPIVILRVSPFGTEGIPYGILYVMIFLLFVFVIVAFYLGSFVSRNITNPVFALSKSMEKNKQSGELKRIDATIPPGEINMLKNDYNSMIDHINELIATLIEKEKTVQRAEMRVLQEQIKPHFLYNSIETIGFLALDAGAENVHDALETLGSFYRNFLSKGDREIPLAREIRIVKDYLALQKLRYGDIIDDIYDIDEDAEEFVIPKLILQPLVENSIYHGIRLKGEKGIIKISGHLQGRVLHLSVRDTGVGMAPEQIQKVLSLQKSHEEESEDESFGLWGTIQRLRIYCNREDVVHINSEAGEFTEVEFMIYDMHNDTGGQFDEQADIAPGPVNKE